MTELVNEATGGAGAGGADTSNVTPLLAKKQPIFSERAAIRWRAGRGGRLQKKTRGCEPRAKVSLVNYRRATHGRLRHYHSAG